jgi:translation initiation factor IF-1
LLLTDLLNFDRIYSDFVYEGTIVELIKNIMFHVHLHHNNETILGYLSGNMCRHRICVLLGDRVKIQISEFDSKKKIFFIDFLRYQNKLEYNELRMIMKRWRIPPLLNA